MILIELDEKSKEQLEKAFDNSDNEISKINTKLNIIFAKLEKIEKIISKTEI